MVRLMKIITHSPEETVDAGVKLGKMLSAGDVIAFKGGLGAGKTTFTRGIAVGLGLGDNVTSPTFALVNEYIGKKISLYHFDMYRIETSDDLESTGFYDYPFEGNVVAVEWSENIADALPENTIYNSINTIEDDTREITVENGDKYASAWN